MCLLKTLTKLICGAQVSFAAIKILIQEEAENTGYFVSKAIDSQAKASKTGNYG